MTNPWFKNCTDRCRDGSQTCDCDFMPGRKTFFTQEERKNMWMNDQGYPSGYTHGWQEPWVVETWRRHSERIGGPEIAARFRKNLLNPEGARVLSADTLHAPIETPTTKG